MVARVNRVIAQIDRHAPPPFWADVPSFTGFAEEVQAAMLGEDLPYPQRQKLIRRAAQFNIRRFDANLIIALVQHRAGKMPAIDTTHEKGGWSVAIAVALTLQAVIIASICILLHR